MIIVLAKDQSLVHNTHIKQLTTPRDPKSPPAPALLSTYPHTGTYEYN